MTIDIAFEILGTAVGLLYLYYEYKADMKVWIAGIIMPVLSLVVYYNSGLYADFAINIYYVFAGVYGYVVWKYAGSRRRKTELLISNMPHKIYVPILIMCAVLTTVLCWTLT